MNLTLLADHKLRARHEAEQGALYALQLMQSEPLWEQKLLNKTVTNTSLGDVYWNVTVKVVEDFGAKGSLTNPIVPPPGNDAPSWDPKTERLKHFYEIAATGVSSVFPFHYRLYVEEFRLCDAVAVTGKKPFLFALENSHLLMLDPKFTWTKLADLGTNFQNQTLTGNGGDVYIGANSTAAPPQMFDLTPAGAKMATVLPTSWEVLKLKLDENKLSWVALPDPTVGLGKGVSPPTVNGVEGGTPTLENGVDVSEYKGPSMEYFEVNGDFYGDKTSVYCLAAHHFYLRNLFKNGSGGGPSVNKPGGWYQDVCILRCEDGKWSVVTDCLKVVDNLTPPVLSPGPRPVTGATSYLCSDGTDVYALGNGPGGYTVLKAEPTRFTDLETPLSQPSFFFYRKKLRKLEVLSQGDAPSYTGLAYPPLYPTEIGGDLGKVFDPRSQTYSNITIVKEKFLKWGAGTALNGVCVVDDDIITSGNCSVMELIKPGRPELGGAAGGGRFLSHYDGGRWQIWPAGLTGLLEATSPATPTPSPTPNPSATPPPPYPTNLATDVLALGAYQVSAPKLLRRYQVIMQAYP